MMTDVPIQSGVPNFFRELRRTQSELNRLFGGLRLQMRPFPAVNIWAGQDGAIVTAAIPGADPDNLEVTVQPQAVLLRGERIPEDIGEKAIQLRAERVHGSFSRTVVLPFRIEPGKVTANIDRGILTLDLPRPEEDRPRHIKLRPTQAGATDKSERTVQSSEPRKQEIQQSGAGPVSSQARLAAERSNDGSDEMLPVITPPTDAFETDDAIIMFVDMPAGEQDSFDVTVAQHELTISARIRVADPAGYTLVHAELREGRYEKSFGLSEEIDDEQIDAVFKDGVLRLTLPKAAQRAAKKVDVKLA